MGDKQLFFIGKDFIEPIVTLISPGDLTEDTDGIVDFNYNVTDANSILNCSLYLDNVLEDTDTDITKGITQTFQVRNIRESNEIRWFVSCFDKFNNKGNSTTWRLDTKLGASGYGGGGGGGGNYSNKTLVIGLEEIEIVEEKNKISFWLIFMILVIGLIFIYVAYKKKILIILKNEWDSKLKKKLEIS